MYKILKELVKLWGFGVSCLLLLFKKFKIKARKAVTASFGSEGTETSKSTRALHFHQPLPIMSFPRPVKKMSFLAFSFIKKKKVVDPC